jgi:tetratricopeptide (TPR) repeat protein
MYALNHASYTYMQCGDYVRTNALLAELAALAEQKGAAFWKSAGLINQGMLNLLTGKVSEAVRLLETGINAFRLTGATAFVPWYSTYLATAYASLEQRDDALRTISEAIEAIDRTNVGVRLKSYE